jgi:N-acetyl sugar amidotransferase
MLTKSKIIDGGPRYDEELLRKDRAINYGPYRQCSVSVMDTIADPDIRFDEKGICNYYYEYLDALASIPVPGERKDALNALVEKIKAKGKNKPYDCLIGLSGGVDSTYLAYLTKELGLRPLAVHLDNGWDSELAVQNIENIVNKLGIELYTHVIDWEEFRDLQMSFIKASVVDIELVTDHAIYAITNKLAHKYNIGYILNGANVNTENTLPKSWIHPKRDHINIQSIHKAYGSIPLKTFPLMDMRLKRYTQNLSALETIGLLHYVPYNKSEVKQFIQSELNWRDYGGKHYESIWTRFYQGYILPQKFKIDKRKAHLSDLVFGGQITKAEALEELKEPIYEEKQMLEDYEYVLKKLRLSHDQFQHYMKLPPRSHYDFDYEKPIDERYPILRPVKKIYRSLFVGKNK